MGPYCNFCNTRCFTYFPDKTPDYVLKAYNSGVTIIATCPGGQSHEKKQTGYCYNDIMKLIKETELDKALADVHFDILWHDRVAKEGA